MPARRFAIIDPAAGISGDMLLGALIDLGASPDWLAALPGRLGVENARVEVGPVDRCGLRAVKVTVRLGGAVEEPGDVPEELLAHAAEHEDRGGQPPHEHGHHGGVQHHHGHHGAHRHVGELLGMIDRAPLSAAVKRRASRAFELLAEAEGRVHGMKPEHVALHEVGAFDALIDIVGAVEGFEQLGVEQVFTLPVSLGNGWVRAAHGVLPVPAPATSLLLQGLVVAPGGPVHGEASTPTGIALLRALTDGSSPGAWRSQAVGFGAGARNPERYPNALKVMLVEPTEPEPANLVVVATDVDDLSPEYLEPLREALVAAGAIDVQTWATQMKKGRIGFRVEALAPRTALADVARAFFVHSSTAGVRWWPVEREVLARDTWELDHGGGAVRVKTLHAPDGVRVKPEFDDVVAAARRTSQPAHQISRRLQEEALRRVRTARGENRGADNDPPEGVV